MEAGACNRLVTKIVGDFNRLVLIDQLKSLILQLHASSANNKVLHVIEGSKIDLTKLLLFFLKVFDNF